MKNKPKPSYEELEEKIRKLEEENFYLSKAQHIGAFGHFRYNSETKIFEGSPEFYRIFDADPADPSIECIANRIHPDDVDSFFPYIERCLKDGTAYDAEYRLCHKIGRTVNIKAKGKITETVQGSILFGVVQEITNKELPERVSFKIEESCKRIIETINEGIILKSASGEILTWNRGAEKIFGISAAEAAERSSTDTYWPTIHEDGSTFSAEDFPSTITLNTGRPCHNIIIGVKLADGGIKWISVDTNPVFDESSDTPSAVIISFSDITEHKKTMEEFAAIFSMSLDMICIADINTATFLKVNPAFTEILGFSEEELLERPFTDLIHPDDFDATVAAVEKELQTGKKLINFENRFKCKDGGYRWLSWASHPIPEKGVTYAAARDITQLKLTEEKLRNSEKKYKSLFNSINDGICLHEIIYRDNEAVDYRILDVNPEYENQTGVNKEDAVGALASHLYGAGKAPYLEIYAEVAGTGNPVSFETYFPPMDKYFLISVFSPAAHQFATVFQDISERKQFENELINEKERLSVTLRSIGDGVITTDIEGCVVLINTIAEKLTGWTQQEASGKHITEIFHIINEHTRRKCDNPVEKVLEAKAVVGLANHTNLISRDGVERMIADSGAPIFDSNGEIIGVVLVFRDVTEKYKIESRLQQTQKMEAIGVLAGGIAHDFNNMLGVITGNTSYALSFLNSDEELFRVLSDIQEISKKAQSLTHQLLTFSKGGAPIKKAADVNKLVKESAVFSIRGANVNCKFDLSDDLLPAEIDEGQINQVIGNLIINASQAMPNGGTVSVRTENTEIENETDFPVTGGKYIKIIVEDQGGGIPRKYLGNIFDPYFTTKQKGSGLGLATAFSIIKKHDGHITVYSEIEKGTVFNVYLPASSQAVKAVENIRKSKHEGQGRILIMDDEEFILEITGKMLNRMGYETETAPDGAAAIEIYRQAYAAGNPFDLVILDLTVPEGMGGVRTITGLLKIDPDVKAVVSSGYSNDPIMSNYEDFGFCDLMPKPYTMNQLSELLDKVFSANDE